MTDSDQTLRNKLDLAQFKLKSVLGLTLAINDNCPTPELLERYCDILKTLGAGVIVVFDSSWKKEVAVDIPENYSDNADEISSALSHFKDMTIVTDRTDSVLKPFDIVIPVSHKSQPLAYALVGATKRQVFGGVSFFDNLVTMQAITNIVIVALENKRLHEKAIEQESLTKEMEMASKLQTMLIPSESSLPRNDYFRIASFYYPHSMVGGDYYDFLQLNDHAFGFCIGDVSGKGISAAFLMSNFQANLRFLSKHQVPIAHLIKELNQLVNKNSQGDRFVTFFVCNYNVQEKVLRYVNAGHNPPLLRKKDGGETIRLTQGCVGLVMVEEIPRITVGKVPISAGDKLLCFTDGVVEAENAQGEMYGSQQVEKALVLHSSASDVIDCLRHDLKAFLGPTPPNDDISIMCVEFL